MKAQVDFFIFYGNETPEFIRPFRHIFFVASEILCNLFFGD